MKGATLICMMMVFSSPLGVAQDFKKSYSIAPGGQIVIGTISGTIKIEGYKGIAIEVVANKHGVDREQAEIVDRSAGNAIDLRVIYRAYNLTRARVDFEIKVPSNTGYNFRRISTFDGDIEISRITGGLRAESVRGNIEIRGVTGLVSASSHSGNIRVEIDQAEGRNNMRFSSISGNVTVLAPAELDALIDMSSMSGQLKTDFPIEIHERRYGPGRSARGRLGQGKQILFMTSVSGMVSLLKK